MATINLNDYVVFIGTPINIAWTYGTCAVPAGSPVAGQPSITNAALGTIDPATGTPGAYTYHVDYEDSDGSGCVNHCIDLTVNISDHLTVEWIETDDGYMDVTVGSCTGEFYHMCDFDDLAFGGDSGDLTLRAEFLDGPDGVSLPADLTGTISIDLTVNGVSMTGWPKTTGMTANPSGLTDGTYAVNDTSVDITLTGTDITNIRTANGAKDLAEAQIEITLSADTDVSCTTIHEINLLLSPNIDEATTAFDCSALGDPAAFDLYDFILNAGTGNTAPGALDGGACAITDNPNEQDGWHYWILDNIEAELYAEIQANLPACSGVNDFTNCIVDNGTAAAGFTIFSPLTAGNQMLIDMTALATLGSHTLDLTHYVEFFHNGQPVSTGDASVYTCVSTGVQFDFDSTNCCSTADTTATPITVCN